MFHDANSPNYPSPSSTTTAAAAAATTITACDGGIIRRVIGEISSLISLSHTIRVFPIKWQLIRTKLEELNAALTTAENCPSTTTSPLCNLLSTVEQTHHLATRCISVNFSGKLLMQSDLDLVISKLEHDLKSLSVFYSAVGVLSNGFSLVVSKPGVNATKDDVRFFVRDLLTRIKIGDYEMKIQALISLNEIVIQDEKWVKIVVEMEGLVLQITGFLDSNDSKLQEEASMAVGVISGFEEYRGVLLASGVIGPLIRVIETGTLRAKQEGLRSLERLTRNGDNAWGLSAHGGVTALLGICSRECESGVLAGFSCWVLNNLVVVDEIKRFMIEEGAVQTLVKLVNGKDEMGQIGAIETLIAMSSSDECVKCLIVRDGGGKALVRIMDPKAVFGFKSRETALRGIEILCFWCVEYVNLIISYGFLDQVLFFLRNGDVSMQELAFKSGSRLCLTSEEARKSMGDAGFMLEFVKFLEAKSYEIREMAAEALSVMLTVPKNRKKFAQEDQNIGLVLQLLDPKQGNSGNFKFLLSILLSLSSCNHARKRIANSGYVNNIEKLADAGVSDAKKIIRKLSTNRFRSMLNGIWHS